MPLVRCPRYQSRRGIVTAAPTSPPAPPPAAGLHVVGSRLVAANGTKVYLRGVDDNGTEYACIQGWGIWDNTSASDLQPPPVQALLNWHVNFVRIDLNEDCWLGINQGSISNSVSGSNYRNAIVSWVNQLHQNGIYTEIVDMWNAPGANDPTFQDAAPDEDHSPAMWASMAQAFANDPNTMLSPGGEEVVTMQCQMQGTCSPSWKGQTYQAAGLAQGVSVIRQNGLTGPISLECATYANNYSGWLTYKPTDSLNPSRLLAEVHVYGGNAVDTPAQENSNILPVIQAGYPLIYGEVGETYNASSCAKHSRAR
jgi:hypothetical protein